MGITPQYVLVHRLCANHYADEEGGYNRDRARRRRKKRRVLVAVWVEVLPPEGVPR
jgi:hypothetical protein